MEEDVEIEMLLKINEKELLEAAKEINKLTSQEIDRPGKCPLSSFEEITSSQNKENITENMISDHETFFQLPESSLLNESNEKILNHQDVTNKDVDGISNKEKKSLSLINEDINQEVNFIEGADDQVNQHLLDLIATDPVKYYLSQQNSYISQFEDQEGDDVEELISSDDDWNNDFEDDDFVDVTLDEPQFKTKTVQEVATKAIPALIMLGQMLLKRNHLLSKLVDKLQKSSLENKKRQKELQDALIEAEKNKTKEPSHGRCSFKKFGMPYFSDDRGFCAPPNKDHQQKLDNDELMTECISRNPNWIKPHKDMLKNAIKKTVISEKSAKLTKEIMKLKSMLDEAEKDNKGKIRKLQGKIIEKQNEIRDLYKKSFNELVLSENDNREYDWMKFSVSLFDGLHSAEECKRFWNLYLKPSINKEAWSESEDLKLLKIGSQMGFQDWDQIASLLGTNRSGFQCFLHYKARIEGKSYSHYSSGKWTKGEDKKLLTVINSSKVGDFIPWTKISSYMGSRRHSQIYNRWANSLNPKLVKGRFSKEEDLLIVSGIEVFGISFKELASFMSNRTSSQLRERYERHLLPKTKKVGSWSLEEDEKLLNLVKKYGGHNWCTISREMKTRTRTQVRQRYGFIQKMRKKNSDWTIAQVKRRDISVNKNVTKTINNVKNLKKDIEEVVKVFELSEIEKDTFLTDKLLELRNKVYSKSGRRGRKKREISADSQLNDTILDLFKNCFTKSLTKTTKSHHGDFDNKVNELFMLANFFGHTLKLPKTEEEIQENPRLSFASKYFLKCFLNTKPKEYSTRMMCEQQMSSTLHPSKGKNDSTVRIDCPIPEHDDTIIMMEWWHTPPVNVSSLNFSEFFKRTVFDYSYGMHKDIWDSKVKRSQVVNTSHDYPANEHVERPPSQSYMFPPNQYTILGKRSLLLSRTILEKQTRDMDILKQTKNDFLKKEVDEDGNISDDGLFKVNEKVISNLCNQFQDNLLSLFVWPHVLSATNIRSVPVHCSLERIKARLQGDLTNNNGTALVSVINNSLRNGQPASSTNSNDMSQKKLILQEKANQQLTGKNISNSKHVQTGRLVKKRKLDNASLDIDRGKNCKIQKISKSKCVKTMKNTSVGQNSSLNDNNQSTSEIIQPLGSTCITYSKEKKSTERILSKGEHPKKHLPKEI